MELGTGPRTRLVQSSNSTTLWDKSWTGPPAAKGPRKRTVEGIRFQVPGLTGEAGSGERGVGKHSPVTSLPSLTLAPPHCPCPCSSVREANAEVQRHADVHSQLLFYKGSSLDNERIFKGYFGYRWFLPLGCDFRTDSTVVGLEQGGCGRIRTTWNTGAVCADSDWALLHPRNVLLFPLLLSYHGMYTELMRKTCGKDSHFWINEMNDKIKVLLNGNKVDSSIHR